LKENRHVNIYNTSCKFRLPFTFVTFECSLAIIGPQNKFIYNSRREYDDDDDDDDDENPLMDFNPPPPN